jgi:hypothetical protein
MSAAASLVFSSWLISQTGVASPDWWAVAELDVACE